MGLDPAQVRDWVVRPALKALGLPGGPVAEKLVFATGLQESDGFRYIHQLGKGPALGLFQIEPATLMDTLRRAHEDHLLRLDAYRPGVLPVNRFDPERIVADLGLAAACCRLVYLMKPFTGWTIPSYVADRLRTTAEDWCAGTWKRWYNSPQGAGTEGAFLDKWRRFKVDELFEGEA